MKRFKFTFFAVFFMIISVGVHSIAVGAGTTSTGFYWPIGEGNFNQASGGWLSDPSTGYYADYYHIGVDMMTYTFDSSDEDSHVYSIADGVVIEVNQSGSWWGYTAGIGNYVVFIRHKQSDGSEFVAEYGHIQLAGGIAENDTVKAGQYLGYTGDYPGGIHLHFGLHPGSGIPYSNSSEGIGWGRMALNHWPDTNGFIDPIAFIQNNAPYVDLSDDSNSTEINLRMVGDIGWYPSNVDCFDANMWFKVLGDRCIFSYDDNSICFDLIEACPAN